MVVPVAPVVVAFFLALRVLLGDPFPATRLPTTAGAAVALPAAGQIVVVEIFATWCTSCREALPIIERLRSRFDGRVTFVAVSEDDGDDAAAQIAAMAVATGLSGPILRDADHALYRALGVRKLPTAYLVDASGVVRHIDNGFGPGYQARLAGWLEKMLRAATL